MKKNMKEQVEMVLSAMNESSLKNVEGFSNKLQERRQLTGNQKKEINQLIKAVNKKHNPEIKRSPAQYAETYKKVIYDAQENEVEKMKNHCIELPDEVKNFFKKFTTVYIEVFPHNENPDITYIVNLGNVNTQFTEIQFCKTVFCENNSTNLSDFQILSDVIRVTNSRQISAW